MTVLVVRHAKAGDRGRWIGPDDERPLTKSGWAQAGALATMLPALLGPAAGDSQILTSPYLRCRQTVEPLAEALGIDVVDDRRLEEGRSLQSTLTLLSSLPADPVVLCSHGDVIGDLGRWLINAGLDRDGIDEGLTRRPGNGTSPIGSPVRGGDDPAKGSTWMIERHGTEIVSARYIGPPEV